MRLVVLPERAGKTAAQNLAAAEASGEVLIFTDATTELHRGSVRELVAAFADPRVGCVGAELEYVSEGGSAVGKGGGLYWRYEKRVKELEAAVSTLIGVSGCLYAVRASAYRPIEPDLISDFVIAGDVFQRGFITVYGGGAVSSEKTHEETGQELEMRVRVIVRTINALVRRARMLNPFRYGFFSFQLFSHKVLRYLVPELLLAIFGSGLYLAFAGGPCGGGLPGPHRRAAGALPGRGGRMAAPEAGAAPPLRAHPLLLRGGQPGGPLGAGALPARRAQGDLDDRPLESAFGRHVVGQQSARQRNQLANEARLPT